MKITNRRMKETLNIQEFLYKMSEKRKRAIDTPLDVQRKGSQCRSAEDCNYFVCVCVVI
jgi:hypothetical protein